MYHYNWRGTHHGIRAVAPITRPKSTRNGLLTLYIQGRLHGAKAFSKAYSLINSVNAIPMENDAIVILQKYSIFPV